MWIDGGHVTAYDIKLIMNKDVCDIIRPQWILDSVAKEELVPLVKKCIYPLEPTTYLNADATHRYFFHATTARTATDDYSAGDSDAEDEAPSPSTPGPSKAPEPSLEEQVESQIDPSMAEWFDVGAKGKSAATQGSDSGSETEPEPDEEFDSDNEDMKPEAEVGFEEDEDWEQIEREESSTTAQSQKVAEKVSPITTCFSIQGASLISVADKEEDVRMGDDEEAMHYDQELIFKHL